MTLLWLQRLLEDPSMKYIADGVGTIYYGLAAQQSVVTHSADGQRFRKFMNQDGHLPSPLWMPMWDVDELEELRRWKFPRIDRQLV